MSDQQQPPGMPPVPFSLATLINRLRGQAPADYSYAMTRLGRQPQLYARDPQQFAELDKPTDYGATVSDVGYLNYSPLAAPVKSLIKSTGGPVSVIAPYQRGTFGPGGEPGTEPGVPLHEATHQFTGDVTLPPALLFTRSSPQIKSKVETALKRMGYTKDQFTDEIPARLIAGQYASLGLSQDEGHQLRQTYLEMYQKMAPEKAARMGMYTKGRTPVSWIDPKTGQPVSDPNRNPETGVKIK